MSRSYNQSYSGKTSSGREAFGNFATTIDAGDYIQNKKNRHTTICTKSTCVPKQCVPKQCVPNTSVANQGDYLLRKRAIYNYYNSDTDITQSIKTDLQYGLVSKMVLSGISVIKNNATGESPTTLNPSVSIPYFNYTIDPSGNLFGNSICGINNFENYVVLQ
jgi:hypothetical protein